MIVSHLHDLRPTHHSCLLHETPEEQAAVIVPFIQAGLDRRELCAYVADEHTTEQVQSILEAGGIDVRGQTKRGALHLMTKYDSFLRYARFDPQLMIEFLDKLVDGALKQGFTALRFASEMTWALSVGCDGLIEYEAQLNKWYPKWRAVGLCLYNRASFTAQLQRDILRTHPLAVLEGKLFANCYYEPPDLFLGQKPESHRVEWMLNSLKRTGLQWNGGPVDR